MFAARVRDPETFKARQRAQYQKSGKQSFLRYKFGISLERFDEMLREQEGRCYLCADLLDPTHTHVDHSHACCPGGRTCGACVRGLACRWCNQGLGQFRDDPERMRRAATALERAEATIQAALARTGTAPE